MQKTIQAVLSLLLCALLAAGSAFCAAADDSLTAQPLYFGGDGRFKILHVTDTHLRDDNVRQTLRLIALACDVEKPDLIMLTGDLAPDKDFAQTERLTNALMQVFDSRNIPVAVTFGNHDSETGGYTRESVMALYNAFGCSISIDDGDRLTGCGTYRIPICAPQSGELRFNIWVFDSGDYDGEGHYANTAEDQVAWYRESSAAAETENGRKIYSLVFQHIIVPQVYDALERLDRRTLFSYPRIDASGVYYRFADAETNRGMLHEKPCCGYYDHGQFAAMRERGDVLAMFFGHDHSNAFSVRYEGIDIVNSLSTRFNGDPYSTQFGFRVVELDENAPDRYETRVVRWYDFARESAVRDAADSTAEKTLLSHIRFFGFFQKTFTNIAVFFAETLTGRTVRYPD